MVRTATLNPVKFIQNGELITKEQIELPDHGLLLSEKFQLFNGVFGASDEVLGSIESGVDFERRIVDIYQTCRTYEAIQASFDTLQAELAAQISENMRNTRQKLLGNFDTEVAEKLNVYKEEIEASLNRYETLLWETTQHILDGQASFDESSLTFRLKHPPKRGITAGLYTLKRRDEFGYHYRLQHPLAQWILKEASSLKIPQTEMVFDYSGSGRTISILKPFIGQSGSLTARRLTVSALEAEDYIITAAITDTGKKLDADQARRLFNLPAHTVSCSYTQDNRLQTAYRRLKNIIVGDISQRNAVFFEEEMDKLNHWAEDKRKSLKTALKEYDDQIAELKKQARIAPNLPEKLEIQKKVRKLDKRRNESWHEYDDAAAEIEKKKDSLIDQVEKQLHQNIEEEHLFTVRWKLI
ncbi:helicase (Snf2/Rad54 family) [Dehalococcoides mccartyi]|nr:helicase (Snf2/Rad54 family) [Dehalococcoides mccartyi]